MRARQLMLALAVLLALAADAVAQSRGLLPADFYKEVAVSDVAVSPTGAFVAFTATTVVEKDNRRHRTVWLQRLRDGQPEGTPFQFTDPTEDSSAPVWSPDGARLAFTSRRGSDDNTTWFARVTAPGGEAHHIEGVEGTPVWSPDGRWIAYVKAPDDGTTPAPRQGWIAPDAITRTLDAERFDGRVVTSMRYKSDGTLAFVAHPLVRAKRQIMVVSAEGGEPRQLTRVPFDAGQLAWSRDSTRIYFVGDEAQDDEHSAEPTTDIYVVAREGGEPRRLTANPGGERAPAVSPDGRRLAFLATPARGAETDLMVVDLAADGAFQGAPRNLTAAWDLTPGVPEWRRDGAALWFGAGIGGNQHVFDVAVAGGPVRQMTRGDRQLSSVSLAAAADVMAYAATDAVTPDEVFVARADGSGEARVTRFNDAWLAEVTRMPAERLTWTVAGGTTIEGWLVKPVGYQPGRKYPMVLKIHGGPHGAYGNTWFRTFHVLSNAGFFVLYPNPRGSTNYGHAFTYATRGKWGEMDSEDFLTGVDTALARYADIDPRRIGVSGGSYGGFMTNWLSATTDRFAAAVTSRSITNWESWYGASDAQGLTEYEFFGPPWEQRELYRRLSPITYVEQVTIPTLIIHSENDYRTPIADGEQWFMALMKRKVPVELVRYPRSSHGLSRTGEPWLLVDRLERMRSWFVHWLIEQPAPTVEAPPH
ncbi:MAG: S9 family peptidase [Vicinamibacterales bacterium]|nr:S9 family peptidase [Vicinamibacterales bacterium]